MISPPQMPHSSRQRVALSGTQKASKFFAFFLRGAGPSSSLSSKQRDVLWTLAAAGEENLPVVLNTLRSATLNLPDEVLISALAEDLQGIWKSCLIALRRI